MAQSVNQVLFKYGTETGLQTLRNNPKNIEPGAFYITSDTNRMYLGVQETDAQQKKTNKIVSLNQGVITVANVNALPTTNIEVGQFYYATDENVLCVYSNSQWVQINPDTDTYVKDYTNGIEIDEDQVNITSTITNSDNSALTTYLGLTSDPYGKFTITLEDTEEKILDEDGKWTGSYKKRPVIKFENKLSFKADLVEVNSNDANNSIDDIYSTSINLGVDEEEDEDGNVSRNELTRLQLNTKNGIGLERNASGTVITIDGYNLHQQDIRSITQKFNTTGAIQTVLTRNNNDAETQTSITPMVEYGGSNTKTTAYFVATSPTDGLSSTGKASLDVYTTGEVNALLQDNLEQLNAMTYVGTTPSSPDENELIDDLFTPTNVCIGDTYKVAQSETYTTNGKFYNDSNKKPDDEIWARLGDLLIANSSSKEEDVYGHIRSEELVWDYVPSGDDVNNIYSTTLKDYGFTINETGSSNQNILDFSLKAGTNITLGTDKPTGEDVTENDNVREVTINHATISTVTKEPGATDGDGVVGSQSKASSTNNYDTGTKEPLDKITYISGLVLDNGHITQIQQSSMDLVDTNAKVDSVAVTPQSPSTNIANLITTVTLQHPSNTADKTDSKEGLVTIESLNSNLQFGTKTTGTGNSTTTNLTMSLVWGAF